MQSQHIEHKYEHFSNSPQSEKTVNSKLLTVSSKKKAIISDSFFICSVPGAGIEPARFPTGV